MPRHHQAISPNRPLLVEIPTTGLEAAIATSSRAEELDPGLSTAAAKSATEADIRLGERTAFIPMTCQEMQILDRLEAGLQQAACLWRDQPEQLEHEALLGSAMYHWQTVQEPGMDNSWVWEVGRWNTQFSLPFALELRRLNPSVMADADQLLAQSTCERQRQLQAAQKKKRVASTSAAEASTASGKKKHANSAVSDQEEEEEPCLCQIRWGLAPDTEAAKRRQIEKLDEDQQQQPQQKPRRSLQKPRGHQQQQSTVSASCQTQQLQSSTQPRRPIVKTSHLREQWEAAVPAAAPSTFDDPGYASQGSSPPGYVPQQHPAAFAASGRLHNGSYIGSLLSTACYGGRDWLD
ncbi:hypothetical protein BOX15_Mlig034329g2 [Macrostomum lignano]|uniref:Uncharacterized protein n=1 Tax=Macrostomum lignano TaxID=282301 RepID=A0A267H7S3_9PLAT|nr:hypothetical protein BOX15_Mlig034329g1 [Macrostomum lignano]PAA94360.1 hypothetical protein BOX15_Mlig034329g2 [Macrostomum lignano]